MKNLRFCTVIENESSSCSHGKRDILSYLPDPIRTHILSYLPMKDAIKTKVLSKRWGKTSNSLSNLGFCSSEFKNLLDFKDFVDTTLILHDGSDVRQFELDFDTEGDIITSDRLSAWVNFAIDHNVEHLSIFTWFEPKMERLPFCFFTCSTLSFIFLKGFRNLKCPQFMHFPVLKHLDLQFVTFHDGNVVSKLFSCSTCPMLEHLSIFFCTFERLHTLSISFPTLKYLRLYCEHSLVVNLSIHVVPEFHYEGTTPPNISCEALSTMSHVSLNIYMPDAISEELASRSSVRKILVGLHNVEKLTLSNDVMEILSRDPDLLDYLPASYFSLKHLFFTKMPTESHTEVMACLLRTSPNLQTLGICMEDSNPTPANIIHMQGYWKLNELSIAECLRHLKSVRLFNFGGLESEMDIVKRLLESARILEKIEVSYTFDIEKDAERRMKISEKLSSFPRVSPHATIIFVQDTYSI